MKAICLLLLLTFTCLATGKKIKLPLARDAIIAANKDVAAAIAKAKNAQQGQQVTIPRSLQNALPPDALNSILSNAASISNGKGPLTILPPRVVSADEANQYEKDPGLALRHKRKAKFHRSHRQLNMPYFNPGPGFMDVGSNGFSPLSFAMMRPDAASMSPFVPRNTPPPPIRIQLQDPLQDNYKRLIMSESESRVNKEETEYLENTLDSALRGLSENFITTRNSIESTLDEIKNKAVTVEEHKQSNEESARNMERQIEKLKQERLQDYRNKAIGKLIGEIASSTKKDKDQVEKKKDNDNERKLSDKNSDVIEQKSKNSLLSSLFKHDVIGVLNKENIVKKHHQNSKEVMKTVPNKQQSQHLLTALKETSNSQDSSSILAQNQSKSELENKV